MIRLRKRCIVTPNIIGSCPYNQLILFGLDVFYRTLANDRSGRIREFLLSRSCFIHIDLIVLSKRSQGLRNGLSRIICALLRNQMSDDLQYQSLLLFALWPIGSI